MRINKTWKHLIVELLDRDIYFDLVNRVLTFKVNEEKFTLWYWFGQIRIKTDRTSKAGEMEILEHFHFKADGDLILNVGGTRKPLNVGCVE